MGVRLVFALIFAVYILAYSLHLTVVGSVVYGDGLHYYSWLTALAGSGGVIANNKYSIGPALFWFPWYRLFSNEIAVGFASVFHAIAGLILLFRLLIQRFSERSSLLSILLTGFATNLFFYGAIDPVNSHALSFFSVTLFLSLLYSKSQSWFIQGLSLGLVGMVRPQDMIVGLLVKKAKWVSFFAGLAIGFFPQIIAWQWAFGNPFALPYLGRGEGFVLNIANSLGVLFAPSNGLFLWTPVTILGCLGLLFYKKAFAIVFFIELLLISSWSTWWQGASFSGRMFVGMLPLLSFGLAKSLSMLRIPTKTFYLLIFTISALNFILIFYFLWSR